MDFARKQLEKYGWTDGKGLGKHENGISEALKPKLKRSVAGIGHDAAADFTEHWWTTLYNKAAGNVQVEEKNGKTKKIKTKDNEFKITNSTWKLNKKSKYTDEQDEYSEYFVRKAVLLSGGSKTENVKDDSESEEEVKETKDVTKMTDEELFAACGGRTAHKGARHGLKATGKLGRIERKEKMLLSQPQYNGYTHSKKNKNLTVNDLVIEDVSLNSDTDHSEIKKKKKKRKHCLRNENNSIEDFNPSEECYEPHVKEIDVTHNDNNEIKNEDDIYKKLKKSKRKTVDVTSEDSTESVRENSNTTKNNFDNDKNDEILNENKRSKKCKKKAKDISEGCLRKEDNSTGSVKETGATPNDNIENDNSDEIINGNKKLKKSKRKENNSRQSINETSVIHNENLENDYNKNVTENKKLMKSKRKAAEVTSEGVSTDQFKKNKKEKKKSEVFEEMRMFSSDNLNEDYELKEKYVHKNKKLRSNR